MKVEREYDRGGALAYVAAWDVHRTKLFGRCEAKSGIAIVQRKVLTQNDFTSLAAVAERLAAFERYYETLATPFQWAFTRADLTKLLQKMITESLASLRLVA